MESSREYLCPVECPGRSAHCHEVCEQHAKFRELREAEREQYNRTVVADTLTRNVFRYERKWNY